MNLLALILCCVLLCGFLAAEDRPITGMRVYPATVERVIDGDTAVLSVDLGFDFTLNRASIRLVGVYAPELSDKGGAEAKAELQRLLPTGATILLRPVISITGKEQRSFIRYVGRIWSGNTDVCKAMTDYLKK